MAYTNWIWIAFLLAAPTQAADMEFQGYSIEADGPADARQILRVQGKRYAIPGTPVQVVGKAQLCLGRKDSSAGVVSVDAIGGRLAAVSRVNYGVEPSLRIAKGRLAIEASEGKFGVVLGNLGTAQASSDDSVDPVFAPILLRGDSGWEPALTALLGVERKLVDCMFS